MHLVRFSFRSIIMPGRPEAIVRELSAVVKAVCKGDADAAVEAMHLYHEGAIAAWRALSGTRVSRDDF